MLDLHSPLAMPLRIANLLLARGQRQPLAIQSIRLACTGRRERSDASDRNTASRVAPLDCILIANRGEIAVRISRTASQHGIRTVTVYTDPDRHLQHAKSSPWSFNLGGAAAYLDQDKILAVAKREGCKAVHPGYGFLSENADFATRCAQEGLVFIGPPPSAIDDMGDKARSKEIMTNAGVPCVPGYHGADQSLERLMQEAEKISYPVLIKAVRGGGGKGMRIARSAQTFPEQLASAQSEAKNSFGNDEVLVEKYITTPRHIEVQIFADQLGNCVALGERDCSIQRRHQKIIEESPAPNLDPLIRRDIWEKARAAALAVSYEGAGTVEFIFDNDTGEFFFMEMNTRLQVEHPVTEMVTGQDLVHWQFKVAGGLPLPLTQEDIEAEISNRGHGLEARIYAENPEKGFIPDSGKLLHVRIPHETVDVRIDSGFVEGDSVSSHYDPMISKLIIRGETREDAVRKMAVALEQYEIAGPVTNIEFLKRICRSNDFVAGRLETGYIDKHHDELFAREPVRDETLAQAAIASLLQMAPPISATTLPFFKWPTLASAWLAPSFGFQSRTFHFTSVDEQVKLGDTRKVYSLKLCQTSPSDFLVTVLNSCASMIDIPVQSNYNSSTRCLTTFFPHTRLTTRVIFPSNAIDMASSDDPLHLFTNGIHTRLLPAPPPWLAKALGTTEKANSLLSPMPCKILRVTVKPGDVVKKDQTLLVIESMKMETVIRSPAEGFTIRRVVHQEGDVVGSGVELVEFQDMHDQ